MITLLPIVAWVATDAARVRAQRLASAIKRAGIKQEHAADVMGLGFRDLNDQLRCAKPLNMHRVADLFARYPEIEEDYYALGLRDRGWQVIRDAAVQELVATVQELRDLLPQRRRMAKASWPGVPAERKGA